MAPARLTRSATNALPRKRYSNHGIVVLTNASVRVSAKGHAPLPPTQKTPLQDYEAPESNRALDVLPAELASRLIQQQDTVGASSKLRASPGRALSENSVEWIHYDELDDSADASQRAVSPSPTLPHQWPEQQQVLEFAQEQLENDNPQTSRQQQQQTQVDGQLLNGQLLNDVGSTYESSSDSQAETEAKSGPQTASSLEVPDCMVATSTLPPNTGLDAFVGNSSQRLEVNENQHVSGETLLVVRQHSPIVPQNGGSSSTIRLSRRAHLARLAENDRRLRERKAARKQKECEVRNRQRQLFLASLSSSKTGRSLEAWSSTSATASQQVAPRRKKVSGEERYAAEHDGWYRDEDKMLLTVLKRAQPNMTELASSLQGKTEEDVMNRLAYLREKGRAYYETKKPGEEVPQWCKSHEARGASDQ